MRRYNDTVIVESRYNEGKRAGNLNLIDFKKKNIDFSNVSHALISPVWPEHLKNGQNIKHFARVGIKVPPD